MLSVDFLIFNTHNEILKRDEEIIGDVPIDILTYYLGIGEC